jgi:hypothetical protein
LLDGGKNSRFLVILALLQLEHCQSVALYAAENGLDCLLRRGWLGHELLQALHILLHVGDQLVPDRFIALVNSQKLIYRLLVHSQSRSQLVTLNFQEAILEATEFMARLRPDDAGTGQH